MEQLSMQYPVTSLLGSFAGSLLAAIIISRIVHYALMSKVSDHNYRRLVISSLTSLTIMFLISWYASEDFATSAIMYTLGMTIVFIYRVIKHPGETSPESGGNDGEKEGFGIKVPRTNPLFIVIGAIGVLAVVFFISKPVAATPGYHTLVLDNISCNSNGIGEDWSHEFKVNGERLARGEEYKFHEDDSLYITATSTEDDDAYSDTATRSVDVSKGQFGGVSEIRLQVEEDYGRGAGDHADVTYTYSIK